MLFTTRIVATTCSGAIMALGMFTSGCTSMLQTRKYILDTAEWRALDGGAHAESELSRSDEVLAQEIKSFFEAYGVGFPEGGHVIIDRKNDAMYIRSTRDQLELIEALMRQEK